MAHAESFLPRDRAFALIAESFSGPVAIALMAKKRWPVTNAVLSAIFARSPRPLLSKFAGLIPPAVFGIGVDASRQSALGHFGRNGGPYPEAEKLAMALTGRLDPVVLRRRALLLQDIDVSGLLAAVEPPVLCLRARRDRVVPARCTELLLSALRDARAEDIDAPHLLLQSEPRLCAELVIRHIDASAGARAPAVSVEAAEDAPQ